MEIVICGGGGLGRYRYRRGDRQPAYTILHRNTSFLWGNSSIHLVVVFIGIIVGNRFIITVLLFDTIPINIFPTAKIFFYNFLLNFFNIFFVPLTTTTHILVLCSYKIYNKFLNFVIFSICVLYFSSAATTAMTIRALIVI